MSEGNAAKLMDLFVGSPNLSFRHMKTSKSGELEKWAFTVQRGAYDVADVRRHLAGEVGLAMTAKLPNGTVRFAVMDIDEKDVTVKIADQIDADGFPLVACRSKRGGTHVYYFLPQEEEEQKVMDAMVSWATDFGFGPDVVVHPQNCILLPYFLADKTERWAYNRGRKLNFDEFAALGRHRREEA